MLSSVRCVFRVQHVSNRYDDFSGIKLFPTNENRNGVPVEGHKRFWEATPAGSIELHIPNNSRAIGIFSPGGYVFVDISEAETASPPVGIRSEWNLKQVSCSVGSFEVALHPAAADWDRGGVNRIAGYRNNRNTDLFGESYPNGHIELQINNLATWDFFAMRPSDPTRRFVIDFSEDRDPGSHEEKGSLRRS